MTSPTDQMAARADKSAFACVPRSLVEEFAGLVGSVPSDVGAQDGFELAQMILDAARKIADAALDDIS